MFEFLCGLVALAIVLAVVAVLGHLLWLFVAFLVRQAADPRSGRPPDLCPMCAKPVTLGDSRCAWCGFRLQEPKHGTLENELEATERQVRRLASAGRISSACLKEMIDGLGRDVSQREHKWMKAADADAVAPDAAKPDAAKPAATAQEPSSAIAPGAVQTSPAPSDAPPSTVAPPIRVSPIAAVAVPPSEPVPQPVVTAEEQLRGLASVLQSFMEEKNIRWGELVSGLLIVGSSVGLVISLWATLKQAIPYFPVAVFLAATAAMHGAGLYTLHRWRLKATSRGLLLVSMLLVPLNVVAAIALREHVPVYAAIDYAAIGIGLAVLIAIAFSAARILNRQNPWPLFVAVAGTTVGMSAIGGVRVARQPGG